MEEQAPRKKSYLDALMAQPAVVATVATRTGPRMKEGEDDKAERLRRIESTNDFNDDEESDKRDASPLPLRGGGGDDDDDDDDDVFSYDLCSVCEENQRQNEYCANKRCVMSTLYIHRNNEDDENSSSSSSIELNSLEEKSGRKRGASQSKNASSTKVASRRKMVQTPPSNKEIDLVTSGLSHLSTNSGKGEYCEQLKGSSNEAIVLDSHSHQHNSGASSSSDEDEFLLHAKKDPVKSGNCLVDSDCDDKLHDADAPTLKAWWHESNEACGVASANTGWSSSLADYLANDNEALMSTDDTNGTTDENPTFKTEESDSNTRESSQDSHTNESEENVDDNPYNHTQLNDPEPLESFDPIAENVLTPDDYTLEDNGSKLHFQNIVWTNEVFNRRASHYTYGKSCFDVYSHVTRSKCSAQILLAKKALPQYGLEQSCGLLLAEKNNPSDNEDNSAHSATCPSLNRLTNRNLQHSVVKVSLTQVFPHYNPEQLTIESIYPDIGFIRGLRMYCIYGRQNATQILKRIINAVANCFHDGTLNGKREGDLLSNDLWCQILGMVETELTQRVRDKKLLVEAKDVITSYQRRNRHSEEPDGYEDQTFKRILLGLMFLFEEYLKLGYNTIVVDGIHAANPTVEVNDLDFTDGPNARLSNEVLDEYTRMIDEGIDEIVLNEEHDEINLIQVLKVGENVPRATLTTESFSGNESAIVYTVCLLGLQNRIPIPTKSSPDQIDWENTTFYGRTYDPFHHKRPWYDDYRIAGVLTGRNDGCRNGVLKFCRNNRFYLRKYEATKLDESYDDDDNKKVLIYLKNLAMRHRDDVLENQQEGH